MRREQISRQKEVSLEVEKGYQVIDCVSLFTVPVGQPQGEERV